MYARYALEFPFELKVVGVTEPREFHRDLMRERHSLDASLVFSDWRDLAALDRVADCVLIATQVLVCVCLCVCDVCVFVCV